MAGDKHGDVFLKERGLEYCWCVNTSISLVEDNMSAERVERPKERASLGGRSVTRLILLAHDKADVAVSQCVLARPRGASYTCETRLPLVLFLGGPGAAG